jgi:phenylpropionate dioxygenase-like ring-hydroxylating dioxygenase large terminal subunit
MSDPILLDDWHPIAASKALVAGTPTPVRLLDTELVLWRDAAGQPQLWLDRCPHRGARLSLGRIVDDRLVCAYHGWRFGSGGACLDIPAQPGLPVPARARVPTFALRERYGLVWACLGQPGRELPVLPETEVPGVRTLVCGPFDVASSGPRIIENFLDLAHFAYVHTDILGQEPYTEVPPYAVEPYQADGERGLLATGCRAWQPLPNSRGLGGGEVEYRFRVTRPLSATLNKLPQAREELREAISLHVQPLGEESSRVWFLIITHNDGQPEETQIAFQERIVMQDLAVLESQTPRRLPLAAGAELSMACDRLSVAYRHYLQALGLCYGVLRA